MKESVKYRKITYGHLIASWHILFLANKYDGLTSSEAISITEKSGKLGGTVPAKHGLKLCCYYGLVRFQNGEIFTTDTSSKQILPKCSKEDLNIAALRAILSHIISFHNFDWLLFYDIDSTIFREYVLAHDSEWAYLLDNATLFDFNDNEVNIWWSTVLSKYEDYKSQRKKDIGNVGERLTYESEIQRITNDKFLPAKSYVKWAARINDKFGYDILSIRGRYFLSTFTKKDKIQIEVKSSENRKIERFRFFISKPEWVKAVEKIESYYFYCWVGVNIEEESAQSGPYIIAAKDLKNHIPKDQSDLAEWSECRCILDLSKYNMLSQGD